MTTREKEVDERKELERRPQETPPHDERQEAHGHMLALQRSAGNAAVAAMIARRDKKDEGGGGILADIGAAIGAGAELLFGPAQVEIGESVGRGGKNVPEDVAQVRSRLTGLGYASGDDVESLGGAIERYQGEVVGLNKPDGRVDPGGRTVKALSARKGKSAPAPAPEPAGGSIWGDPAAPAAAPTDAGKPAAPGAAPAAPVPAVDDAEVAKILGSVKNAAVTEANGAIATLEEQATKVKKFNTEEKGEERDALVEAIGKAREKIAAIGPGLDAQTAAQLRAHFYHRINAVSPSYTQENIDILEMKGQFRTCNVTSLAMTLEALGYSPGDYQPQEAVKAVAKVYAHRVAEGRDRGDKTLEDMRLPDFLQLAAVAEVVGAKVASEAAIRAAGGVAWNSILNLKFIGQLGTRFGASVNHRYFKFNATLAAEANAPAAAKGKKKKKGPRADADETWDLREHGKRHRTAGDAHADAANELEDIQEKLKTATGKQAGALEERKKTLMAKVANTKGLSDAKSDIELPVEQYKDSVLDQVGPVLDSGGQVILGMWNHFARLQELDDEYVVIDDPAQWGRANRKVTWEEARAMGYFWQWLVVS